MIIIIIIIIVIIIIPVNTDRTITANREYPEKLLALKWDLA